MKMIDVRDAKLQLSELVDKAAEGEQFIISIAGKPLVMVIGLGASSAKKPMRRLGFLRGKLSIPDDFDTMGNQDIIEAFEE